MGKIAIIFLGVCFFVVSVWHPPFVYKTKNKSFVASRAKTSSEIKRNSAGDFKKKELEDFFDPLFLQKMKEEHIPGAVISVVQDGEIIFTKGYGYADLNKKTPVIPDKTVFRVGSLTKLFTATAVMQLCEQGKLSLNDDVNSRLRLFKLKTKCGVPVTVKHLLTHTGGFIDGNSNMFTRDYFHIMPLSAFLKRHMPPSVLPAGQFQVYSSYGIALAGYLVEERTGIPFAQYAQENILMPLSMTDSGFLFPEKRSELRDVFTSRMMAQSLDRLPAWFHQLAVGYEYRDGIYYPQPLDYVQIYPAGDLSSTAVDMAHFMIAHLQNGAYEDKRILQEATAQEMHRRHFSHYPQFPGSALGFFEKSKDNQRILLHSGGVRGFGSWLFLYPQKNTGVFISYNNFDPSISLGQYVFGRFLSQYYSLPGPSINQLLPTEKSNGDVRRFAGVYRWCKTGCAWHTFEKLLTLFSMIDVRNKDGNLALLFPGATKPIFFEPVGPLLFQSCDDAKMLFLFRENKQGIITHALTENAEYVKLPWYEYPAFHRGMLSFFKLIFILASVVCLFVYVRLYFKRQLRLVVLPLRLVRFLAGFISILNLFFIIGFGWVVFNKLLPGAGGIPDYLYHIPLSFYAFLIIPLVTTPLSIVFSVLIVLLWKQNISSAFLRLYYSVVALTAILFIPFLIYYNLLGFNV